MSLTLNKSEIEYLKICGKILSNALNEVVSAIKPGISGDTLDKIAENSIRRQGAKPSFLNYGQSDNPFPATICLSINNEVVHGLPSAQKIIRDGDLVSIDIGAEYKGVCTDMAKTVIAGKAKSAEDSRLLKVTAESLSRAIPLVTTSHTTGDIGEQIQTYVESFGYSVVRALVGHGIGREPHQDPQVPNYGKKGTGFKLIENMAIAIEPMVNVGGPDVISADDGWTVKTLDGSKSAHFEHTILITNKKPIIVTL